MKYRKRGGFCRCHIEYNNQNDLNVTVIFNGEFDSNGKVLVINNTKVVKHDISGMIKFLLIYSTLLFTILFERRLSYIYTPYILFVLAVLLGIYNYIEPFISSIPWRYWLFLIDYDLQ